MLWYGYNNEWVRNSPSVEKNAKKQFNLKSQFLTQKIDSTFVQQVFVVCWLNQYGELPSQRRENLQNMANEIKHGTR